MPPTSTRLILCEQHRRWSGPVRLALRQAPPPLTEGQLCEVRQLEDCDDFLQAWPASLLAVEITEQRFEIALQWISRWDRLCPDARVAVLWPAFPSLAVAALREAGAVDALRSTSQAGQLVKLASRHAARVPDPQVSVCERILADLPWRNGS